MTEEKVTAADIRDDFPDEKRRNDFQSHLWAYLVVRPLSFYLTPFFINRGMSANAVTVLGLVVLLGGLGAVLGGVQATGAMVAGAVLINVWYVLDFVDGNVARYRETESEFGAFLDWYVGIIYHAGLPLCIGTVVYLSSSFIIVPVDPVWWLVLAVGWVVAMLSRKLVAQKVTLLKKETDDGNKDGLSTIEMIAGAYTSFKAPLFFLFVLFAAVDVWLLLFGLYGIASTPIQLFLNISNLQR